MERDPRDTITEQSFRVDPALLGTVLASPWRRLAAVSLDTFIAAIFANIVGATVINLAISYLLFRGAARTEPGPGSGWRKWLLIGFGVIFLAGAVASCTYNLDLSDDERAESEPAEETDSEVPKVDDDDVRDIMEAIRLVQAVTGTEDAVTSTDTEAAATMVASKMDNLMDELEEVEEASRACAENQWTVKRALRVLLDTVGLTVGWIGLYFTVFLSWWKGQTPAKRLLRLRVVRLDGSPITVWHSFNRFSGYSAGFATGLLGFAEALWDQNRQAIHDRIAATVVVRTDHQTRPPSEPE
ncbi:MAG: RDD family protein [Myxococcota bacterium]